MFLTVILLFTHWRATPAFHSLPLGIVSDHSDQIPDSQSGTGLAGRHEKGATAICPSIPAQPMGLGGFTHQGLCQPAGLPSMWAGRWRSVAPTGSGGGLLQQCLWQWLGWHGGLCSPSTPYSLVCVCLPRALANNATPLD